jgi:hypothetical protein
LLPEAVALSLFLRDAFAQVEKDLPMLAIPL